MHLKFPTLSGHGFDFHRFLPEDPRSLWNYIAISILGVLGVALFALKL